MLLADGEALGRQVRGGGPMRLPVHSAPEDAGQDLPGHDEADRVAAAAAAADGGWCTWRLRSGVRAFNRPPITSAVWDEPVVPRGPGNRCAGMSTPPR